MFYQKKKKKKELIMGDNVVKRNYNIKGPFLKVKSLQL